MLLIEVNVASWIIHTTWFNSDFIEKLRMIVADELRVQTMDRGETPKLSDVEVRIGRFGLVGGIWRLDVHQRDLEVIITANHHPEREANLHERKRSAAERLSQIIPAEPGKKVTGSVWIRLVSGSYGQF